MSTARTGTEHRFTLIDIDPNPIETTHPLELILSCIPQFLSTPLFRNSSVTRIETKFKIICFGAEIETLLSS